MKLILLSLFLLVCLVRVNAYDNKEFTEAPQRVGGIIEQDDLTHDAEEAILSVKEDLEQHLQTKFTVFKPLNYAVQVVAGINYFVKVAVDNNEFIHVRIFRDIKGNYSLSDVETGHTKSDPITYF